MKFKLKEGNIKDTLIRKIDNEFKSLVITFDNTYGYGLRDQLINMGLWR